ncbi:hypothetical protein CTM90_19305 [Photobacterium damselae]|uniref:Uncharacterized protein n=1 Tax=Photobacterium damselae TaxID=38293 RepID=A0ABD6WYR9_PHODM|nr:hypothetical protein CTM90_19305 [Photobacterium damselae]
MNMSKIFATRYSLLATRYSLLATRYSLLATRYSLLVNTHSSYADSPDTHSQPENPAHSLPNYSSQNHPPNPHQYKQYPVYHCNCAKPIHSPEPPANPVDFA